MTDKERIEEARKKAFQIRKKICDGIWVEKWKSNECEEKEIELMSTALLDFNSERIAELERENERLKNHIGESNEMVCNTKKPMYFQVKQKVREVGRIIGCGDEKAEEYEDDKMMELEQMFSNYFGLSQLQKENSELQALFDLQQTRMKESVKLWRVGHKEREKYEPDLGKLLEWFIKENSELKGKIERASELIKRYVDRVEYNWDDQFKQTLSELKGEK